MTSYLFISKLLVIVTSSTVSRVESSDVTPVCHCRDVTQCNVTSGQCLAGASCAAGYWGPPHCTQPCRCLYGLACDSKDGSCSYGCKLGWSGPGCNKRDCPAGKFHPPECLMECHCAQPASCQPIDGSCSRGGCSKGYWGPDCQELVSKHEICNLGEHNCTLEEMNRCYCTDPDCKLPRGVCVDGSCPRGLTGPKCDKKRCPRMKFGPPACNTSCHCKDRSMCDPLDGSCHDNLCDEGWSGSDCQTPTCSRNYFGYPTCKKMCFCDNAPILDELDIQAAHCNDSGECPTGCKQGWHGESCNERSCPRGKWGVADCSRECHCKVIDSCNSGTGECELGDCQNGWIGFYCDEQNLMRLTGETSEEKVKVMSDVLVFVIGLVIFIVLFIPAFFIWKAWKKSNMPMEYNQHSDYTPVSQHYMDEAGSTVI